MRTKQTDIPLVPRMVWGNCGGSSGGVTDPGSADWTCTRSALGVYSVFFNKPFAATPIVLTTLYYGGGGIVLNVQSRYPTAFTVAVFALAGNAIDSNVMFTAMGLVRKDLN